MATIAVFLSRQLYLNRIVLKKYSFLNNIAGRWYGIHFTNCGTNRGVSLHLYELRLVGRKIVGKRIELGLLEAKPPEDPATYELSGAMHNGALVLSEACEDTREIGITVLTNFAIKNILRGVYTGSADFNGIAFSSPIVLKKNDKPTAEDLYALAKSASWCAWDSKA